MNPAANNPKSILQNAKLRCTPARMEILAILISSKSPLSHEQISNKIQGVNKVTIYRTLETFLAAEIIHQAFNRNRTWHYESAHNCTDTQCHPHFTCSSCGITHCVLGKSLPLINEPGFIIQKQQVSLEGLCPKCK